MKLYELSLELARAQMARQSVAGTVPRIMSVVFQPMDEAGRVFSCRAMFAFGCDFVCSFELDGPADLNGDWEQRLDASLDCNQMWMQ